MRARFWLDYIAATKFLLCGHIQNAKAVYEARKAFFDMKPKYEERTQGEPGKDNPSDYPGADAQQPNPRFLFEREKKNTPTFKYFLHNI